MNRARVLIVGAGPSGLTALKEMREAGLDAVAVDVRPSFGGVFAKDSGVTFDGLHLTISNVFMAFSDLPPQDIDKGVKYWSQAEYYDYLVHYVDHFELEPHLRLQTKVEGAHFNQLTQQWEVRLMDVSGSGDPVASSENFDKLIVASGANHKPKLPESLQAFAGEVVHSADYHSAEQLRGKKVLVVGTGESAADVATSATKTADRVTLWGRRYPDCAPRFVFPYLKDAEYDEQKHINNYHKPNGVLESLTTTRIVRNLPLGLWSVALQGLQDDVRKRHGANSTQGMGRALSGRAWSSDYFSSDTSMVPTKSAMTLSAAARGELDIVIAPSVEIDGHKLSFTDASLYGASGKGASAVPNDVSSFDLEDVDVIVACTGFDLSFDWITFSDETVELDLNTRTWFKHAIPAEMGDYLAFVGFARPHSGGIPQCSEIVSRYIAQLYAGNLELPENYADLAIKDGAAERACFHLAPDYNVLVDYSAFMVSVARLLDVEPRIPALSSPSESVKYWTFPMWPCFFRTRGVGANPRAAEAVLSRFGPYDALTPSPLLEIQLLSSFVMPFINGAALAVNAVLPNDVVKRGLPGLYKWRTSKAHMLYHNSLTGDDFKSVLQQWTAALMIIGYRIRSGVSSVFARSKTATSRS